MPRGVWNEGTAHRYGVKAEKIALAQGARPEKTYALVDAQARMWEAGAGLYRRVRDMARRVMIRPDTLVQPISRVPYYAFAQRCYKLCVVTHEADPEDVIAEFKRKDDTLRDEVMEGIVEELGLGKAEAVARTAGS